MADETGRNLGESEFLRKKEAEYRSGENPSDKKDSDESRERGDEQIVDTAVENTFRH